MVVCGTVLFYVSWACVLLKILILVFLRQKNARNLSFVVLLTTPFGKREITDYFSMHFSDKVVCHHQLGNVAATISPLIIMTFVNKKNQKKRANHYWSSILDGGSTSRTRVSQPSVVHTTTCSRRRRKGGLLEDLDLNHER